MLFCRLMIFFIWKNYFRNTISVSNSSISVSSSLNPDQDRHSVGPDLGPNCLQRSSADDTSPTSIIEGLEGV